MTDDRRAVERAGRRRGPGEVDADWKFFLQHAGRIALTLPLVPWIFLYALSAGTGLFYSAEGLLTHQSRFDTFAGPVAAPYAVLWALPLAVAAVALVVGIYLTAAEDFAAAAWRRLLVVQLVLLGLSVLALPLTDLSGLEWLEYFGILVYAAVLSLTHLRRG